MENRYPRLEINLAHLQHNVSRIVEKCGSCGIQVAGVIKGATGHPEVAKAFDKGGAAFIASSRLEQIEDAIDAGIEKPKSTYAQRSQRRGKTYRHKPQQ